MKEKIKSRSISAGFDFCGFASATAISPEGERFEESVQDKSYDGLPYLAREKFRRKDPRLIMPSARTVIALTLNYYQEALPSDDNLIISRYAYGQDYHLVIRKKLDEIIAFLKEECGSNESRAFVDSGPVLEKGWASKAGLGWQGKHTILINQSRGSFFFIGIILTDLYIEPDLPETDHCGSCTRCIDACPTNALSSYRLDPTKCISNLTIEDDTDITPDMAAKFGGRIFGCDICQEACPYNRFAIATSEPLLTIRPELKDMNREKWLSLGEEQFDVMFENSPVKRTGYEKFMENVRAVAGG